jgi:large subunit ribosomal protein L9
MKVLLLQDVPKVGKKGEIVNASDGYARNYLLPKKLAVEAKEGELKHFKNEQKVKEQRKENAKKKNENIIQEITKHKYEIKANAGENGKLFGAVTANDVAKRIKEVSKVDFDKLWFDEKINLKELGLYRIKVKLSQGVKGEIIVEVKSV